MLEFYIPGYFDKRNASNMQCVQVNLQSVQRAP